MERGTNLTNSIEELFLKKNRDKLARYIGMGTIF